MIGFALNIVAFAIGASILIFLGLGALAVIAAIFGSLTSSDNKTKGLLQPVLRILGISEGGTIRTETSKEVLKESIKVYYGILHKVFESETPDERKKILTSDTPSGKLSNAFFSVLGLGKSLNTLTKDFNYVMEGSGWTEYKRILKDSIGGTLKKIGDKKYEMIFNKDFHLTIEEYQGYDYTNEQKEWRIEGYYNNKEVLSCYAPRTNDTAYTFKPDVWILDILKSAEKYSKLLDEMKLRQATERAKAQLFN